MSIYLFIYIFFLLSKGGTKIVVAENTFLNFLLQDHGCLNAHRDRGAPWSLKQWGHCGMGCPKRYLHVFFLHSEGFCRSGSNSSVFPSIFCRKKPHGHRWVKDEMGRSLTLSEVLTVVYGAPSDHVDATRHSCPCWIDPVVSLNHFCWGFLDTFWILRNHSRGIMESSKDWGWPFWRPPRLPRKLSALVLMDGCKSTHQKQGSMKKYNERTTSQNLGMV